MIEPDDGWDVVFAYGSRTHLVYAPEGEHKTLCGMTVPKFQDGLSHSPVWQSDALMAHSRHSGPWRDLSDAVAHRVNCQKCLKAWRKRFG